MSKSVIELVTAIIALIAAGLSIFLSVSAKNTVSEYNIVIENQNKQIKNLEDSINVVNNNIYRIEKKLKLSIETNNTSGIYHSTNNGGNQAGRDINIGQ